MKSNATAKHQQVRDSIVAAIRSGEFPPDQRLPAERELADRFGVSYMTARRAVSEMVESDLLERRSRAGTFIRSHAARRLSTTTLNLICPANDTSSNKAFLRFGTAQAEARGWRPHLIRLHGNHVRPAVRAIEEGDFALVLPGGPELQGPLGATMQMARGRAVLIGNRLDSVGVPSVLADDSQAIRLAVAHLKEAGHRAIALLSAHPEHAVEHVQIAAWRACFSGEVSASELERRLIVARPSRHACVSEAVYDAMRAYLRGGDATALICVADELAVPALAACRDAGWPVPQRISFVNSGDSPLMAFSHPPVTCIDVHIEQHIIFALEMLEAAAAGRLHPADRLRLVEPHLIERASVAAPAH